MKRKIVDHLVDILFLLIIFFSSLYAISTFSSKDVFDAQIYYINDEKLPYGVNLRIEKFEGVSLDEFSVEILHDRENVIVGSRNFSCDFSVCETKVEINKVFFDGHSVIVKGYEGDTIYEKKLNFTLSEPAQQSSISLEEKNLVQNPGSVVQLRGTIDLNYPSKVILKAISVSKDKQSGEMELYCESTCDFIFNLSKTLFFGDYELQVYHERGTLREDFRVDNYGSSKGNGDDLGDNKSNLIERGSDNKEVRGNEKIVGQKILEDARDGEYLGDDIFGNPVYKDAFSKGRVIFSKGDRSNFSKNRPAFVSSKIPSNLAGSSKDAPEKKDSVKGIEMGDSSEDISKSLQRTFSIQRTSASLGEEPQLPEVVEEKIYFRDGRRYIDLQDTSSSFDSTQRKLVPGMYTYVKKLAYQNGSMETQEDIFAYGLLSINTKKPLYQEGEVVDFVFVVLDKWGYLVSDADILLEVGTPDNDTVLLSSQNEDIVETSKNGVYEASLLSSEVGEYSLYAQVDTGEVIVDVESFYNVVDEYSFDILRDVPATIDPWLGPFTNNFSIIPRQGYAGEYDFEEVFSSDFEIIETDADEIETQNGTTYLRWFDLQGEEEVTYTAQTPLVTPYLYYLGKSSVLYDNTLFYENRSWLFAIDPEAKACTFESPCICGSACSGGGEPGDGTIDFCGDGVTTYEYVNDIRVRSLDNDKYFGTGDTVEICVDFQTDSSGNGDRVTIGYKDETAAWNNGDVIYDGQEDNNNLNTICVNQVLNNYAGIHHVRGKVVWSFGASNANDICEERTYYDHDDVSFEVLPKEPANFLSWDLNNGTDVGDNLRVIRGSSIEAFASWDRPLQGAQISFNQGGPSTQLELDSFENNFTSYNFSTTNFSLLPNLGLTTVEDITSQEIYFNISGSTSPSRSFEIFAEIRINETPTTPTLDPYVMYNGTSTTFTCQVIDNNVEGITYPGIDVDFYHNETGFLGSVTTNSTGEASISFVENQVGVYDISCEVQDDIPNYYLAASDNQATKQLIVKENGTDITPPTITGVTATPQTFSIGGSTQINATVTDDVLVDNVVINVTLPDGSSFQYPMNYVSGDTYTYSFSNTVLDGSYSYYILASDNSSNVATSSLKNLDVVGIRTYIGIQTTKDVFKIGENLDLTPYSKVSVVDGGSFTEEGDVRGFSYSFDSSDEGWTHFGTQDEWERGVPTTFDLNTCESGNCWATDLNGDYNANANNQIRTPVFNMSGRSGTVVSFWREIAFADAVNDKIFFESFDGGTWRILYQNTIGAENQEGAFYTYYPSEVDNMENSQFRFRTFTNGGSNDEGFVFDTFQLNFTPRVDWDKPWQEHNTAFGSDVAKLTAIQLSINVTSYDATGSDNAGTLSPDLEVQFYNGASFTGDYNCNLDSTQSFPQTCSFTIRNTPEYIDAWETSGNRRVRIRAVDLDNQDNITWGDVTKEIVTPSIIENIGIAPVTSNLLQQFKNSSGDVVQTLYNQPISINPGEAVQLENFWNFSVPGGFQLGNYTAYVALTDSSGNVLQNEDDGTFINDSYEFRVDSLIANLLSPADGSVQSRNYDINVSLDISSFGSGGWCGYSLNGASNVTMTQTAPDFFTASLSNQQDRLNNSMVVYCNDSDGYMVSTATNIFDVNETPQISFTPTSDANNSFVNRSWAQINVSTQDNGPTSTYLDFNSDLLLYWDSSRISGGTIFDESTYSRQGSIENSVVQNFTQHRGDSLVYGGGNSDRITRDASFLEGLDEFTFSAWVKSDVTNTDRGVFNAYPLDGTDTFGLRYDAAGFEGPGNNLIKFGLRTDQGNTAYESASNTQSTSWQHLVISWRSGERPELYIDGVKDTPTFAGTTLDGTLNPDSTFFLGDGAKDENWLGQIDEVMVWERKLGDGEVAALYNGTQNNVVANVSMLKNGPYAYYSCTQDGIGNRNCTSRIININKTLPQITITSPQLGEKFSNEDIIDFNSTTTLPVVYSAVELENNGVLFNQTSLSPTSWTTSLGPFQTRTYQVVVYANDSIGNQVNATTSFLVYPDVHILVTKEITSQGSNSYLSNVTLTNLGTWENHSVVDFVPTSGVASGFTPATTLQDVISTGEIFIWDFTMSINSTQTIAYTFDINATASLRDFYIIGSP